MTDRWIIPADSSIKCIDVKDCSDTAAQTSSQVYVKTGKKINLNFDCNIWLKFSHYMMSHILSLAALNNRLFIIKQLDNTNHWSHWWTPYVFNRGVIFAFEYCIGFTLRKALWFCLTLLSKKERILRNKKKKYHLGQFSYGVLIFQ